VVRKGDERAVSLWHAVVERGEFSRGGGRVQKVRSSSREIQYPSRPFPSGSSSPSVQVMFGSSFVQSASVAFEKASSVALTSGGIPSDALNDMEMSWNTGVFEPDGVRVTWYWMYRSVSSTQFVPERSVPEGMAEHEENAGASDMFEFAELLAFTSTVPDPEEVYVKVSQSDGYVESNTFEIRYPLAGYLPSSGE